MGSSAIGFSTTFNDLRTSDCTTCMVNDDRSAYWIPELFYHYPNGTFDVVTHGGMTVYYLQRSASKETVEAFPDGLRMLTGDPDVRNNTGSPASKAISWACLNFNGPATPETPGFANTNCPDGLRAQVFFPACWDGVNLDSPDHKSHMAYPDGINNGQCPSTHPHHLISIFYEVLFSVAPFNALNAGGRFVLANGDPTGYALHGDFMDGWDKSVLSRAVQTCTANSGVIEDCPVFANENRFVSKDVMNSCTAPNPVAENVLGPIPYLPGCVAVTEGPGPATGAAAPGCVPGAANPAGVPKQSTSSMPASSSPAPSNSMPASTPVKPPPNNKPASSSTTPAPPSGTSSKPMVSGSPAAAKLISGNNDTLPDVSSSSSSSPASGGPATVPGSTAKPSSVPPGHPHSSSKPEPTGHGHPDSHHGRPQKHGHQSQQHGNAQNDSADMEYCHEAPATGKRSENASVPMRRRHHARRAAHGSY
jgi:hypothetical protein